MNLNDLLQLEKFRKTIFENDETEGGVSMDISDDFRPVQCMFRRRVHASDQSLFFEPRTFPPGLNSSNGARGQEADVARYAAVIAMFTTLLVTLMFSNQSYL